MKMGKHAREVHGMLLFISGKEQPPFSILAFSAKIRNTVR